MNTFVPCGRNHRASGKVLDRNRLGKQLVEVQQIHTALTTGLPVHILHHPATQMWVGWEEALLDYGCQMYQAYLDRFGTPHNSGEYCKQHASPNNGDWAFPDWFEELAPLHRARLYEKNPKHYAEYQVCFDILPPGGVWYPVTFEGKTVGRVIKRGTRKWYAGYAEYPTAWAAIQNFRDHRRAARICAQSARNL